MPRKAEVGLEGRILDAAYKLWSERGEHALTMRAVAKAAGTTTPTLYERFRDKHDLLELLRTRARQNLYAAIRTADSAKDVCKRALEFTARHGHEYRLLTDGWAARFSRKEPMPSVELMKQRLAEELGGASDDHTDLSLALVALVHGTSLLLLAEGVKEDVARQLRRVCLEACEALIREGVAGSGGTQTACRVTWATATSKDLTQSAQRLRRVRREKQNQLQRT
ncbi:MAG: helix-turn-helix domain-containing protein [Candidatus Acidiferrales bacterium]